MAKKLGKVIRLDYLQESTDASGCVVVHDDAMARRVRKNTQSQDFKVVFYDDSRRNGRLPTIYFDNGKDGWGHMRLQNDANLNLRAGDTVRVFFDGRRKVSRIVAVTNLVGLSDVISNLGKKQMYIAAVPYARKDMQNFMPRYLPRLSDKIKFNWAMIVTLIANGGRAHMAAAKNLREMLECGPRQQYLDKLLGQEAQRSK